MATVDEVVQAGYRYLRKFRKPVTIAGLRLDQSEEADKVLHAIERAMESGKPFASDDAFYIAAGTPLIGGLIDGVPVQWPAPDAA